MSAVDQSSRYQHPTKAAWGVKLLGWINILFGLAILGLGIWLILLGGSWYYGLAGLGLLATGIMLNYYMMAAVWLYLVVWLGTVGWAWWEVGADWWAQVPRLVAPTIILILVLLCIPALARRRTTY